jgi:heat shock protein HslJ
MMADKGLNDAYILQITDEGVNGKAAPNRYFAPYERQDGYNIKIRQIVGTYMLSDVNVGGLMENEYYWYLQRIYQWRIDNGFLDLYAEPPNPNEEQGQALPIILRYRVE